MPYGCIHFEPKDAGKIHSGPRSLVLTKMSLRLLGLGNETNDAAAENAALVEDSTDLYGLKVINDTRSFLKRGIKIQNEGTSQ